MIPHQFVRSGDIELAVYTWGKPGTQASPRPTILLVHGYPDAASIWQATAEKLAQHYFVVAYDVRGAGLSGAPKRISDYAIDLLICDLTAVADALSPRQALHLVCHDWGSIQCWEAVTTDRMKGRIASYTSISGPSLDHAGHWLRSRLKSGSAKQLAQVARQFARSWYMLAFQLPGLAPAAWKLGLHRRWPGMLETVEGIRHVAPSATQKRDGSNGVNLYRANVLPRLFKPRERRTDLPVQLIVPRRDRFMVPQIWDDLTHWSPRLWRRDADAGHWIPLSHPQLIADWVVEFVNFVEGGAETPALEHARVRAAPAAVRTHA